MVQDSHVARHDLVFENRAWWNINAVAVVGDDDDGSTQRNSASERHIARHRQMIQLDNIRDVSKTSQELLHFAEMVVAKFNEWRGWEHALWRHDQRSVLQTVQIRHHQQQVRRLLHRQKTRTRHVDTDRVLKAFHRRTDGRLQLNHAQSILQSLVVNDDLHVHALLVQHAFNSVELRPNVVGVEELKGLDGLEVINMLVWYLRNFQQTQLVLVLDQRATLDVSTCLVGNFHHKFMADIIALAQQSVQDAEVDCGTQVVNVREEKILAALLDELLQQSAVLERFVEITVTGWVPSLHVVSNFMATSNGQKRIARDARKAALVEAVDIDLEAGVLADDFLGVVVGVERVHEDEWDVGAVGLVEALKRFRVDLDEIEKVFQNSPQSVAL